MSSGESFTIIVCDVEFKMLQAMIDVVPCDLGSYAYIPDVGPDLDNQSRHQLDSAFFFRTRSQKFGKNQTWIQSHFSISAVAGVCVVIS